MSKIQEISIKEFRGIKQQLKLSFSKSNNCTSVVVYGRNGSGKSSIVDAWEWLFSKKILHLAREGAKEGEYPHKESSKEDSFIEVNFQDGVDPIKCNYNKERITSPNIEGDYQTFKSLAKYPCHLRYRDLQEFVYKTKAEKYEYLANYMGFSKHLDFQNNLSYVLGKMEELLKVKESEKEDIYEKLKEFISEEELTEETILVKPREIAKRNQIEEVNNLDLLRSLRTELKKIIEKNGKMDEINSILDSKKRIESCFLIKRVEEDIIKIEPTITEIKTEESAISKVDLIQIYESCLNFLTREPNNVCPVCDKEFDENLKEHIENKHKFLNELKTKLDIFSSLKNNLNKNLEDTKKAVEDVAKSDFIKEEGNLITNLLNDFLRSLSDLSLELSKNFNEIDLEKVKPIISLEKNIYEKLEEIKHSLDKKWKGLETDPERKRLIEDFETVNTIHDLWSMYESCKNKEQFLKEKINDLDSIITKYQKELQTKIKDLFDSISNDITEYFHILEGGGYLKNPKIVLSDQKNKAIELEIELANNIMVPAHKILSESQINSFGLAIFLSSIKRFNQDFKFIILDDIINSFDATKRPRVIELMKKHFEDYQFLILTHDQIWFKNILDTFRDWNGYRFYAWDYSIGPRVEMELNTLEEIKLLLEKDQPQNAGREFGVYLEWALQRINENFMTDGGLPYRLNNQYTLAELYNAFQSRFKKKISGTNEIFLKIKNFGENSSFRNFCMHWKEPESPITSPELKEIYNLWIEIDNEIFCKECKSYFTFNRNGEYVMCPCGKLNLKEN